MGLPLDELERLTHAIKYERFTAKTVRNAAELHAAIERSRGPGYAEDDCEYSEDVRCVAVPMRNAQGKVVVTVGVSGPASRVSGKQLQTWGLLCARLVSDVSDGPVLFQSVG